MKEIKQNDKCSRCGLSMKSKYGCSCDRYHPRTNSASGNATAKTLNDYHGGYTE